MAKEKPFHYQSMYKLLGYELLTETYLVFITLPEFELDGVHVGAEDMEPVFLPVDLTHMDVASGHSFIACLQPGVVVGTIGPGSIVLSLLNEFLAETLRHQWHPENVRAGLLKVVFCGRFVGKLVVIWVDVAVLPVLDKEKTS